MTECEITLCARPFHDWTDLQDPDDAEGIVQYGLCEVCSLRAIILEADTGLPPTKSDLDNARAADWHALNNQPMDA